MPMCTYMNDEEFKNNRSTLDIHADSDLVEVLDEVNQLDSNLWSIRKITDVGGWWRRSIENRYYLYHRHHPAEVQHINLCGNDQKSNIVNYLTGYLAGKQR